MTLPLFAASPYQGSEAAPGKYYLYQVETNRWLQPNMSKGDQWTTHGELGDIGMDIELRKLDGFEGYQIYLNYTNNGELNGSDGDRFFFDQGDRALSDWIFEPVDVDGVTNGYKIMIKAREVAEDRRGRDGIERDVYIGANPEGDYGGLTDSPQYTTWQLVSAEDRFAAITANASEDNPADVTWLIPYSVLGRFDNRANLWTNIWNTTKNNDTGGAGFGPSNGYPVQERWDHWIGTLQITLTDLPAGRYGFSVQALQRDGNNDAASDRYLAGTEDLSHATYFAGTTVANIMSQYACGQPNDGDIPGGAKYEKEGIGWVPNSLDAAQNYMYRGLYKNPYIEASVTDGSLTIGLEKNTAVDDDWLVYKRFYLQYMGQLDDSKVKDELNDLIQRCEELKSNSYPLLYESPNLGIKSLDEALEAAKQVVASSTATTEEINEAFGALSTVYANVSQSGVISAINSYNDLYRIVVNEEDPQWAEEHDIPVRAPMEESVMEKYYNATTAGEFNEALKQLNGGRRIRAAAHTEDVFAGHAPEAKGKYYLYNVGRKLFLENGSDWGTHASLGHVGTELTLRAKDGDNTFAFEAEGLTGADNRFMGGTGYMDTGDQCPYTFVEVEGKPGVYNIENNNQNRALLHWNPFGPVDAGHTSEANVSAHVGGADPSNPDTQWKLVTREERLALISGASLDNPVDVTLLVSRPGFKKFEGFNNFFWNEGFGFWEENANHEDNGFESWNSAVGSRFSHQLEDLPAGVYKVCINGLYRDGDHGSTGTARNARLFAGNGETDYNVAPLHNINEYRDLLPGDGVAMVGGRYYPQYVDQCCTYFRAGYYNATVVATVRDGYTLPIGVEKIAKNNENDWIVVDNIRIYYYGPNASEEAVSNAPDPNAYKGN